VTPKKLTQAEAARAAGVSRTQIFRAIKQGRISCEKLDEGSVRIDPSELLRVWPAADLKRARNTDLLPHGSRHGDNEKRNVDSLLQVYADEVRQDRERLRAQMEAVERKLADTEVALVAEREAARVERDRLLGVIEKQTDQLKLITDQRERETDRRPWWRRWRKR
jgi:hypothetical protein